MNTSLQSQGVTSFELSQRLRGFGVAQESLFYYSRPDKDADYELGIGVVQPWMTDDVDHAIAAFTTEEIARMLPTKELLPIDTFLGRWFRQSVLEIRRVTNDEGWQVVYMNPNTRQRHKGTDGPTLADALARMVIFLLETGHINP